MEKKEEQQQEEAIKWKNLLFFKKEEGEAKTEKNKKSGLSSLHYHTSSESRLHAYFELRQWLKRVR